MANAFLPPLVLIESTEGCLHFSVICSSFISELTPLIQWPIWVLRHWNCTCPVWKGYITMCPSCLITTTLLSSTPPFMLQWRHLVFLITGTMICQHAWSVLFLLVYSILFYALFVFLYWENIGQVCLLKVYGLILTPENETNILPI